ncbi:MAG: winged helix-turn-helix domain-containing protein [Bosea sp.]|uniref:AsnC family protein n=1 Tax=Bosea sp. (in: a-proteobacteria) TaxID=1871050 RepID=UPI001AD4A0F6|nr:AsnC family protein [Bosea sp. (in: a-proteobacteria)]MBN9454281.1 winged helix-turn-helix domain-containing protein [Bosea sp. (in: a-proteobacteria)]
MTVAWDLEGKLQTALAPVEVEAGYGMTDQPWICGYAGWNFGQPVTPALIAVLNSAHPMPDNLAGAWAEYRQWQARALESREPHISARMAGLEHLMDTLPDASAPGIAARLAWLSHLATLDHFRTNAEDAALAARLAADFQAFTTAVQSERPAESGAADRRTQADRRSEVLSTLSTSPDLPDREIARRVGVSPQTVSNLRKKLGTRCPP